MAAPSPDKMFVLYVVVGSILLGLACKLLLSRATDGGNREDDDDNHADAPLSNLRIAKIALLAGVATIAAKYGVDAYMQHTQRMVPAVLFGGGAAGAVDSVVQHHRPSIQRIVRP